MKVFTERFPTIGGPFALCIGKFDGVHAGHRLILETLTGEARKHSAVSVAYSFEPRNGTPLLTTREEKLVLFDKLGMDTAVLAELNDDLMAMTAEQFIARIAACGQLKAVAVGQGFRFGKGAAGDVELLKTLGRLYGFGVHIIAQVQLSGEPVSSTLIRQYVKSGDMEKTAQMLGREFSLSGEVVMGRQFGRTIGFRTANILPPHGKVIPANGVYTCRAEAEGETWPSMTNVGIKPTVDGNELLIESHLLGFDGDLYGKKITLAFIKKIRDEIKFGGLGQLKEQLLKDESQVIEIFRR